jgi:hypothetical protein
MKKLIVAAVAATMASVSMADISIKGDAYLQYAVEHLCFYHPYSMHPSQLYYRNHPL